MRAGAFVVGPRDGTGSALLELARAIGFQSVARYRGIENVERQLEATPLVFFLFAAVPRLSRLKFTTTAIRFASNARIRFAPMVYFAPELSRRQLDTCVQLGFDDVVTLPYVQGELSGRIFRHVGRAVSYFETASYFGPDRRKSFGELRGPADGRNDARHRRFDILRTQEIGVTVIEVSPSLGKQDSSDAFIL